MKIFSKFKLYIVHCTLLIVILIGALFRLYGLNWDQNYHLHPDERFLTMVTQAVHWPKSFMEYLDPQVSPLNPYNVNYKFFVYGALPMTLVEAASGLIKIDPYDYNNITMIGRFISAIFDLGTLFLVFLAARRIVQNIIAALLAAFLYAISVLPIQLSHYYAVDTFLVFFTILSFYLLATFLSQSMTQQKTRFSLRLSAISCLLGLGFGLALACKITAILLAPFIFVGFALAALRNKRIAPYIFCSLVFVLFSYLGLRFADPRVFSDANFFNPAINPQFINNLKELNSYNNPRSLFPPGIQWINTKPLLFPLKNMIFWGLGLPLGIISFFAFIFVSGKTLMRIVILLKTKGFYIISGSRLMPISFVIGWVAFFFAYQGVQFAKPMRYFLPIYPFLAILAADFLYQFLALIEQRVGIRIAAWFLFLVAALLSIWPVSFLAIYSRPHSRLIASEWIFQNIPPGATISCEYWDDCLPLSTKNNSASLYQTEILHLYDQDTPEKWQTVNQQLAKIDYLILSSNRLWGSIPTVPEIYPIAAKFYEDLFAEKLGFAKIAEITSYPTIPILNMPIPDDTADEALTVYDHPEVLIFRKI